MVKYCYCGYFRA